MCGTFTSILGQAAAIGVIDMVISPAFGMSDMRLLFDFVLKGISTFWVYKYAQCSGTSGTTRRPFMGLNFMTILVGGLIGSGVLAITSIILPNNMFGNTNFMEYIIEAVVLNFAYGMAASVVADIA